jgi:hypothetical protein
LPPAAVLFPNFRLQAAGDDRASNINGGLIAVSENVLPAVGEGDFIFSISLHFALDLCKRFWLA